MHTIPKLFVAMLATLAACGTQDPRGNTAMLDHEAVGQTTQAVIVANKGIILIDRTGSMMSVRDNGHTRCSDAIDQALEKVDEFFGPKLGGSAVAIWTFNSLGVNELVGYTDATTAKNKINTLSRTDCTAMTPLADAMCQAIDTLSASLASGKNNLLTAITDGGENYSRGGCAGTANLIADPTSWRRKVADYAVSKGVTLNSAFLQNKNPLLRKIDPETGLSISPPSGASTGPAVDPDHDGFLWMAMMTGGIYDLISDGDNRYSCLYGFCPPAYYEPSDW